MQRLTLQYNRFTGRCRVGLPSFVAVIAIATCGLAGETAFPADKLMAHVRFLASEDLHGRQAGSSDERRAAEYIAEQLDRIVAMVNVDTIDAPLLARRAEAIYATIVAISNAARSEMPKAHAARLPAGQRVETSGN